jgi:hypothetical protein
MGLDVLDYVRALPFRTETRDGHGAPIHRRLKWRREGILGLAAGMFSGQPRMGSLRAIFENLDSLLDSCERCRGVTRVDCRAPRLVEFPGFLKCLLHPY